jgi:hypothetical protein
LLVLVISMGVVAMHSVASVGACSSGGHATSHSSGGQFSGAHHGGHPGSSGPSVGSTGTVGTTTASTPTDEGGTGWCSSLGHLCLAILNLLGLIVIVGLTTLAAIGRREIDATADGVAVRGARAPPIGRPPSSTSLTELCVSRR